MMFRTFFSAIHDFLFPSKCVICKKYVEDTDNLLCSQCKRRVLFVKCIPNVKPPIKSVWRISKYRDLTRDIIIDLKFNKKMNRLNVINKILDMTIKKEPSLIEFLSRIDIATAVPLHVDREAERGFNQSELIFKDWLEKFNIKIERLIIRQKSTAHLYNLNSQERQQEVINAFAIAEGAQIEGKRILLLDDIYTTGATMRECAKVLKNANSAEIYGLAFSSDFKED